MSGKVPGLKIKYTYEIGVALLMVTLVGLLYSRFLISCGTVGLSLLWIFSGDIQNLFNRWRKNGLAMAAVLICLLYIFSIINTTNHAGFWAEIKNKIPYIFIPLSLFSIPRLNAKIRIYLYGLFILLILISSIGSFYYYLTNLSLYQEVYAQGQIIPTVIHHVGYSLLLVYAVLLTTDHLLRSDKKWIIISLMILLAWLIYVIHLLATRTGLICLYISLPVYLVGRCILRKDYKILVVSMLSLVLAGVLLFFTTDTLQQKISYVVYDLEQVKQNINTDNQLSDSRRILSDKLGWEIAKKNPFLGVGIGDVKDEMKKVYDERYNSFETETKGHIHNQFIYIFAGCGFISGSIFIACIIYPMIYFFRRKYFLLGAAYVALVLVLMWEPFLEYQIGNTIYLLVLSLGINQTKKD